MSNDKVAATHHPDSALAPAHPDGEPREPVPGTASVPGTIRVKHVSIDRDGMGTIEVAKPTQHFEPGEAPVPHAHMDDL